MGMPGTNDGSENCLFLNVYTPSLTGRRAVMFWIHGGAFVGGSGDDFIYGPGSLVREDVVIVTINYRLSSFGFFSTNDEFAPGNQAMEDMVLALKWVQRNIREFGGDPEKVTAFGESAGGVAVHLLMLSDRSTNLFHQGIMQSGTAFAPPLFQHDPKTVAENFGRRLNLTFNSTEELVNKLQQLDTQSIVSGERDLLSYNGTDDVEFVPSVDANGFLNATPLNIMQSGNFRKIPLLIGTNNMDGLYALPFMKPNFVDILNEYKPQLIPILLDLPDNIPEAAEVIDFIKNLYFDGNENGNFGQYINIFSDGLFRYPLDRTLRYYLKSNSNHPIYVYDFSFDGELNFLKKALNLNVPGASHADDLGYLFDTQLPLVPDTPALLVKARMVKMWTNFAKFG